MSNRIRRRSGERDQLRHPACSVGVARGWLGIALSILFLGLAYACDPPAPTPPNTEPPLAEPEPMPDDQGFVEDTCEVAGGGEAGAISPMMVNHVLLGQGATVLQTSDLAVPALMLGWTQTRSINSLDSGSTALGGKWLGNTVDYRLVEEGIDGDIALIVNAGSKRVFQASDPPDGTYTSPSDSSLTLERVERGEMGEIGEFVLTNWRTGLVQVFNDFTLSDPAVAGLLKEKTTLAAREQANDGLLYTYDGSGTLTQITTPEGQDYNIVFSYSGSKITKIEVRTGADTSTRIEQVTYTYFDSQLHSQDVGADGDLVQVTSSLLKTGGSVGTAGDWLTRTRQYRYDGNGMLKAVFSPDDVERLIDDRADISDADDILAKGDDDDNNGAEDHKIKDYSGRQYAYYTVDVKTDNSGAGTAQDPKCVTVWAGSGENLQTKYGGTDVDEVDAATDKYLVKSVTAGGCSSCGSAAGLTHQFFYLQLDHGDADPNEVVRIVVEDVSDGDGNGVMRKVHGLNDSGGCLRQVVITDPAGTPEFWCQSWKLEETGQKLNHVAEYRSPAAHDVSSSTVDEFLDPSDDGDFSNDNTTLNTSAGIIRVNEYNTAGDRTGVKVKKGRTGTA